MARGPERELGDRKRDNLPNIPRLTPRATHGIVASSFYFLSRVTIAPINESRLGF